MVAMVARQFFWPNFVADIRRFVRNCDTCRSTTVWRDRRQGLLRPLPVPDRQWREIAIDFVGPLPESRGCTMVMVVTDRLSKGVILIACEKIDTDKVAKRLLHYFYPRHGLPAAITTDRGPQFTGQLWRRLCKLLGINRRISTAYHPETDGATERANAEIECLLRRLVNYQQDDWVGWLPMVEFALRTRDSSTTGVSPFFLSHGYHPEPLQLLEELRKSSNPRSPIQQADTIVAKIKEATEWAQLTMTARNKTKKSRRIDTVIRPQRTRLETKYG